MTTDTGCVMCQILVDQRDRAWEHLGDWERDQKSRAGLGFTVLLHATRIAWLDLQRRADFKLAAVLRKALEHPDVVASLAEIEAKEPGFTADHLRRAAETAHAIAECSP